METSRLPGFGAKEALLPTPRRYRGVLSAGVAAAVDAQASLLRFGRGEVLHPGGVFTGGVFTGGVFTGGVFTGGVFTGGVFTGGHGGGGAIPLTVHECLRLGGKVELHQWCSTTGLKCTTHGGQNAVCIDEGVVKG
jgi:hypothetical protein